MTNSRNNDSLYDEIKDLQDLLIQFDEDNIFTGSDRNIFFSIGEAYLSFLKIDKERLANEELKKFYFAKLDDYSQLFSSLLRSYTGESLEFEIFVERRHSEQASAFLSIVEKGSLDISVETLAKEMRLQLEGFKQGKYVPTTVEKYLLNSSK